MRGTKNLFAGTILFLVTWEASRPAHRARACTVFRLARRARILVAKSYDWHTRAGLVTLNPRGLRKSALLLGPAGLPPATWRARYASVTFNQYGREFPIGGMNEAGLVVEVLWLSEAAYPRNPQAKAALTELQLVQYLLDTAGTVSDAVARARAVQVVHTHAKVHYFLCDALGGCAVLDYLGSGLRVAGNPRLEPTVLTNDTYERSRKVLTAGRGKGRGLVRGSSLWRFSQVAGRLRRLPATMGSAVRLLQLVRQQKLTVWQLVYDLGSRKVSWRAGTSGRFRTVDLRRLAQSCPRRARVWDMTGTLLGTAVSRWTHWTRTVNDKLLQATLPAIVGHALARILAGKLTAHVASPACALPPPGM